MIRLINAVIRINALFYCECAPKLLFNYVSFYGGIGYMITVFGEWVKHIQKYLPTRRM